MEPVEKTPLYKRILPWAAALLVLGFLFWRTDLHAFAQALASADMALYLPVAAGFITLWFFIESQNLQYLFNSFSHSIDYKEILPIRGSTYLLMIINYGLGVGGMAYYLKKIKGVPFVRSASLMLFYTLVEAISISFLALAGSLLGHGRSQVFEKIIIFSLAIIVIYSLIITVFNLLPERGFLSRLKKYKIFGSFNEATLAGTITLFVLRGMYFATFIIFFYIALKAFYIEIPLISLAAYVPVLFFIGNLPITPFGLGTIQAGMIYFFKGHSSEANILAFSITYSTSLLLFRALIGLLYLRKVTARAG